MIDILRYILFDGTIVRTVLVMTLSGSILAFIMLLLKPLFRERLPKSAQYYLWLIVVAAWLVPISLIIVIPVNDSVSSTPIAPIQSIVGQAVITAEEEKSFNLDNIPPQILEEAQRDNRWISFSTSQKALMTSRIVFLYPIGVLVVLLYYVISYIIFIKLYCRRNLPAYQHEIALLSQLCKRKNAPRLYRNPHAATPMLFGLLKPIITLPNREYTEEQLRAVLLHELTHLQRRDVLVRWLTVFACAVHWFNPVVWLARREIDRACELSCDEAVIHNLDITGKQNYGNTLIFVAANTKMPHVLLKTTMCEQKKDLKERLSAIMKSKKSTRTAIVVSVLLIAATVFTACALGSGRSVPPNENEAINSGELDYNSDNGALSQTSAANIVETSADEVSTTLNEAETVEAEVTAETQTTETTTETQTSTNEALSSEADESLNEVSIKVEEGLNIIMSSPLNSANPQDYIDEHSQKYEDLTAKYSDGVLDYLLSQFESGNSDGLRGQIMMRMCKDMLGLQNNVTDETLSPQEWYEQLSIISEVRLPDYKPKNMEGNYDELIYGAINQYYSQLYDGFLVATPTVYGEYEEDGKLKIIMTVYYKRFKLYGKTLESIGGGIIPGAAIFQKDVNSGDWMFEEYLEVGTVNFPDGAYFGDSIKKLCVMPVSGKQIEGLAEKMRSNYSSEVRSQTHMQNLKEHLLSCSQLDVYLKQPGGVMVKLT